MVSAVARADHDVVATDAAPVLGRNFPPSTSGSHFPPVKPPPKLMPTVRLPPLPFTTFPSMIPSLSTALEEDSIVGGAIRAVIVNVVAANDPVIASDQVDGRLGAVEPLAVFEDDVVGACSRLRDALKRNSRQRLTRQSIIRKSPPPRVESIWIRSSVAFRLPSMCRPRRIQNRPRTRNPTSLLPVIVSLAYPVSPLVRIVIGLSLVPELPATKASPKL